MEHRRKKTINESYVKVTNKFCDSKERALSAVELPHSRQCYTEILRKGVKVLVFFFWTGVAYAVIKMGLELDKQ